MVLMEHSRTAQRWILQRALHLARRPHSPSPTQHVDRPLQLVLPARLSLRRAYLTFCRHPHRSLHLPRVAYPPGLIYLRILANQAVDRGDDADVGARTDRLRQGVVGSALPQTKSLRWRALLYPQTYQLLQTAAALRLQMRT